MRIPHNRPHIVPEDIEAVSAVLHSGWIAQGEQVRAFERAICAYFRGEGDAVAVSSGTAAVYLALRALGVGPDAEVIVPTYSCSALLNAVFLCAAHPIVADVARSDYTIDPRDVRRRVTPRTRAIVAVHIYGMPADVEALRALDIPVIEDCAQSLGTRVRGRPVGAAGAAAIFSFYATKLITTAYGGLVWSADDKLVARLRDYREFDYRPTYTPRFNFQLSDMQAALGLSQLRRLDAMLHRRRRIQDAFRDRLKDSERIGLQSTPLGAEPNGFRFVVELPGPTERDRARQAFRDAEIETIVPIERFELLHRYLGLPVEEYPAAEEIVDRTLSVPTFPAMSDGDVDRVAEVLAALA